MLVAAMAAVFGASGIAAAMPAVAQTASASSTDELQQLQQQISALQAKVNQLEQQQQQQAQTLASQPPAQPSSVAAWAENTKVGGKMYVDFTNIDQTSNGTKTNKSGNGFDVKRFYLSISHKFNDVWSANLTTDFNYSSTDGETNLFVKKAYVQGSFDKLATLRVGSADMPWIPFVEGWYGYRYVENTLTDRLHFANSADWGAHLLGNNGLFNYQISVINGGGYKHPSRSNSVDVGARVAIEPIKGLAFALGGYNGDLGHDTATASPVVHTASRYDAMVAYHANGFRLGGEYFHASNWNNVTSPLTDLATGYSVWASYDFGPAAIFARYDEAKPSKDLDSSLKDTYYNAGVSFTVVKGVDVALAYKHELLKDNTSVDTKTNEIGAWGQIAF
jgi:outer membrane murein-binding lipoprotein Lpp